MEDSHNGVRAAHAARNSKAVAHEEFHAQRRQLEADGATNDRETARLVDAVKDMAARKLLAGDASNSADRVSIDAIAELRARESLEEGAGGKPRTNRWKSYRDAPAKTPESDAMSKALLKRGFKFVGSTIVYAFMQAVGMVNDHRVSCFRHREVQDS